GNGTINPAQRDRGGWQPQHVPLPCGPVENNRKNAGEGDEVGPEFLSMSAHKIYGPKGIGALYMRRGTPWIPWMHGGSQERRRRGGTLNVPGIIGLAKALELSISEMQEHTAHFKKLRAKLIDGLDEIFGDRYQINGCTEHGVPHI